MDRIVLVRLLAQDCRVHARSLAAASGPTIPRAELARSRERVVSYRVAVRMVLIQK